MTEERTPKNPANEPVHTDLTIRGKLAALNDDQRLQMLGALYAITAKTGAYNENSLEVINNEETEIDEFISQLKPVMAPKPAS